MNFRFVINKAVASRPKTCIYIITYNIQIIIFLVCVLYLMCFLSEGASWNKRRYKLPRKYTLVLNLQKQCGGLSAMLVNENLKLQNILGWHQSSILKCQI